VGSISVNNGVSNMRVKHIRFIFLLVTFSVLGSGNVISQTETSADKPVYGPPWTAHSKNFLLMIFHLNVNEVKKLLPKGVEALANEAGMVNTILEMYETDGVSGIPDYKTAFIVVDIKNQDSRNGTPGHFAVWGRVNDRQALDVFRSHFGFPYHYAENITVSADKDAYTGAIGTTGKEVIQVKIELIREQVFSNTGIVNMVGVKGTQTVVKSMVPYLTKGYAGKVVSFEIRPDGDPVLKLIKEATPVWSMISTDQTFSYSHAIPGESN
jgi:hypothetical protein